MAIHDLVVRIGAQVSPGFGAEVKKAFGQLSSLTGAIGGLGIGGMVGSVASLGSDRMKDIAKLNDLNEGLGISVEYLSKLQRVAAVTGTDFGQLTSSLARMTALAGEAPDKFARLGVSIWGANGAPRDAEGLFKDVMTALNAETNSTERATKAKMIFGRAYLDILPVVREYGAEMGQATVLNKEAAESAERYEKNLNRMWANIKEKAGDMAGPALSAAAGIGAEATAKGGLGQLGDALMLGGKVTTQNGDAQAFATSALRSSGGLVNGLVDIVMLQNMAFKKSAETANTLVTKAMDAAGGL